MQVLIVEPLKDVVIVPRLTISQNRWILNFAPILPFSVEIVLLRAIHCQLTLCHLYRTLTGPNS